MKATIGEKEVSVTSAVWNDTAAEIAATLHLDLLDANNAVVSTSESAGQLKPGTNAITVSLALPARLNSSVEDPLPWYRVRYRLQADKNQLANGIVALSGIASDMFELRIVHPDKALPGHVYQIRVHAANPVTRRPIAGVQIRGVLEFDSDTKPTILVHATNSSGDVILTFHISANVTDGGSVSIKARKGDETRSEDFDFELDPRARIIINTDKLLYQPGQSLHARAFVLSTDKHAIANEDVEFKLLDPDSNLVSTGAAKTNEFGIANIDWDLPDSLAVFSSSRSVKQRSVRQR